MKRFLAFCLFLFLLSFLLTAARPLASTPQPNWRDVLRLFIFLISSAAGAPIAQLIKKALGASGRWAVIITGAVAAVLAFLELFLGQVLKLHDLTMQNLPGAIVMVFGVASLYYAWFKESPSFFGKGALLSLPEGKQEPPK